ncbi:GNAT family N-acetyltransferase [Bacillus sp. SG-1]|uniref:GNAT family N-acetyltransferase n=1 Tax=Bacillus sp. SG-1 TaxID=161544 RepID=UPI00030879AF|nr:GNAT family N-acetyltransferase [Bacillus sp. SG-1]
MQIKQIRNISKSKVEVFFITHWGSPEMVISSGIYDCSSLDGFVVQNQKEEIIGMITYVIRGAECEIISLDSLEEGKGVGSSLIRAVEEAVALIGCTSVKLVTTNDNLSALRFYQKRGYHLSHLYKNAVEKARKIKSEIPLVSEDGIPIRDEIELQKILFGKAEI